MRFHLLSFMLAYLASVAMIASTVSMAAAGHVLFYPSLDALLGMPIAMAVGFIWGVMGATILAFPGAIVGYPVAVIAARRLKTPLRTALAGIAVGPFVGCAVTLILSIATTGRVPLSGITDVLMLVSFAAIAGATIGWVVAVRENDRTGNSSY